MRSRQYNIKFSDLRDKIKFINKYSFNGLTKTLILHLFKLREMIFDPTGVGLN